MLSVSDTKGNIKYNLINKFTIYSYYRYMSRFDFSDCGKVSDLYSC